VACTLCFVVFGAAHQLAAAATPGAVGGLDGAQVHHGSAGACSPLAGDAFAAAAAADAALLSGTRLPSDMMRKSWLSSTTSSACGSPMPQPHDMPTSTLQAAAHELEVLRVYVRSAVLVHASVVVL
jgi:hypothetical protein